MHDVFISYSSLNKEAADAICHRLESGGIKCWYAPRDITPGVHWQGAIMDAIRQAKVFILVYSKESNQSVQVLNEITNACQEKCVIIPFRLDNSRMCDELAFYLNAVHWLDASLPPMQQKLNRLYDYVRNVLISGGGKKKRGNVWVIAAILTAVLLSAVVGFGFLKREQNEPQRINLTCVSQKYGNYPYDTISMVSTDMKYICLWDSDDGLMDILRLRDSKTLIRDLDYIPSDSMKARCVFHESSRYLYFIEEDTGILRIYHRDSASWVTEQEIPALALTDQQWYNPLTINKNIVQEDLYSDYVLLLKYDTDPEMDCYCEVILIAPDGNVMVYDIRQYGLQTFVSCFDRTGWDYLLFADQAGHLKILNPLTGELKETNHERISKLYLPYVAADFYLIPPGGGYLHNTTVNADGTVTESVWSLKNGYPIFEESADWGLILQFSGEKEIIYFNKDLSTLYTRDLTKDDPIVRLDRGYFNSNSAFLKDVYAFHYEEEYEACFFMSCESTGTENVYIIRMTVTDIQGNVLAVSDDIQMPHIDFSSDISVSGGTVMLMCWGDQPIFQGDRNVFWSAPYVIDADGNMVFSEG